MKYTITITLFISTLIIFLSSCSNNTLEEKGFSVVPEETQVNSGISDNTKEIKQMKTQPSNVILTGFPEHRLITVYKVNINKETKRTFIGSNGYHYNYSDRGNENGNNWNYHFMPGFEALYGYNLVNISHFDTASRKQHTLFDSPVLIKTFYYPSYKKDTLNNSPVNRDYYMVSVYDEDTNKDSLVNVRDLRRFYLFDIEGKEKRALVPLNYSVVKSEYDPANDYMYVFAKLDENKNGKKEESEPTHIFWIDLKEPKNTGRQY